MTSKNFVFRKEGTEPNTKWLIEHANDKGGIKKSEHGSRQRALTRFFHDHPGCTQFYIIIPDNDKQENGK